MAFDTHSNPLNNKVESDNKNLSDRAIRGYSILAKGDNPKIIDEETFLVPSQSSDKKYKVTLRNEWVCECPDFRYRKLKCKHILAVEFLLKLQSKLDDDSILDFADDKKILKCEFCSSGNIVKNGKIKNKSQNKQRYFCRNCKKTFYEDSEFNGLKANPKIVVLTMDLYYKGLSLRDIEDTIHQFFDVKVSHEIIRKWILKFNRAIDDYTKNLKPKVSDVWHADEQFLKIKGKQEYAWNVLDEHTRFLLASVVTKDRDIAGGKKSFPKCERNCESCPRICSD